MRLLLSLSLWLWAVLAVPQEGAETSSLPPLIREAQERNPDILAARQRWEAARAVIPQVQTLPDPKLILGYKDMAPQQEMMYGMSQEVPFPGKLRLKGEVAASEAERLEQDYLAIQLAVIARLKESFYDLHFVHDAIDVNTRTRLLLQEFEDTAQARYSVGQAAQQDVLRAQTEISRLLARLASLEQKRQSLHADINRLLNRLPGDPLAPPGEISVTPLRHTPQELDNLLERASPLLLGQQKILERGDRALALAKREYYPDFELDARGLRDTAMNTSGYQVMLNVKLPLYFATKQRQGVNEAVAGREASFQDLTALRQGLLSRVRDNLAQAERAEKLVRLLRDAIIPQSRLTLASAQASYAVGKVDFLTLLNSLLTLQENELEFHSEMTEHEKALARIEGFLGEPP